jgi:hypothetical protein
MVQIVEGSLKQADRNLPHFIQTQVVERVYPRAALNDYAGSMAVTVWEP